MDGGHEPPPPWTSGRRMADYGRRSARGQRMAPGAQPAAPENRGPRLGHVGPAHSRAVHPGAALTHDPAMRLASTARPQPTWGTLMTQRLTSKTPRADQAWRLGVKRCLRRRGRGSEGRDGAVPASDWVVGGRGSGDCLIGPGELAYLPRFHTRSPTVWRGSAAARTAASTGVGYFPCGRAIRSGAR